MDRLRYPIGQFTAMQGITEAQRMHVIESISLIPERLRDAVDGLELEQLATPYRPGGWNVRQVVHHLADAEMHAYIRFKRGLTEERPLGGTFREDLWGELTDYQDTPVEISLLLLEALHSRFVTLLLKLKPSEFKRSVTSPTHGDMTLDVAVQRFSWHASHHLAQITSLREREGW